MKRNRSSAQLSVSLHIVPGAYVQKEEEETIRKTEDNKNRAAKTKTSKREKERSIHLAKKTTRIWNEKKKKRGRGKRTMNAAKCLSAHF